MTDEMLKTTEILVKDVLVLKSEQDPSGALLLYMSRGL